MENMQDDDDFNPEELDNHQDYDEVARSLPVFCVSARVAQKLSGRLIKESDVVSNSGRCPSSSSIALGFTPGFAEPSHSITV